MATLSLRAGVGEVVKLYYWARVEPFVRHGGVPPVTQLAQATGDATGLVSFTGQPSRIEFAAQRADGSFVKLMDSTTRKPPL